MSPSTLTIYSNPAILALSQDPAGIAATRVWQKPLLPQNETSDVDLHTANETSFWMSTADSGDYFAAFLNAGPVAASMSASYDDVFVDVVTGGVQGVAETLFQTSFDIYDLWGYRMANSTASSIIAGNAMMAMNGTVSTGTTDTAAALRYNATKTPYAEGLKANSPALMGKKVGVLKPGKELGAQVPRHGVTIYRLRAQKQSGMRNRDGL